MQERAEGILGSLFHLQWSEDTLKRQALGKGWGMSGEAGRTCRQVAHPTFQLVFLSVENLGKEREAKSGAVKATPTKENGQSRLQIAGRWQLSRDMRTLIFYSLRDYKR